MSLCHFTLLCLPFCDQILSLPHKIRWKCIKLSFSIESDRCVYLVPAAVRTICANATHEIIWKLAASEHNGLVRYLWGENIPLDWMEMGLGGETEMEMEAEV